MVEGWVKDGKREFFQRGGGRHTLEVKGEKFKMLKANGLFPIPDHCTCIRISGFWKDTDQSKGMDLSWFYFKVEKDWLCLSKGEISSSIRNKFFFSLVYILKKKRAHIHTQE